ncbi:MAG: hypothetical protein R2845_07305 [Thermomicrobiales bacterium]
MLTAYTSAITDIFLYALPLILAALCRGALPEGNPLRTTNAVASSPSEKPDASSDAEPIRTGPGLRRPQSELRKQNRQNTPTAAIV